jgi:DNA replication protein DnaC
MAKTKSTGDVLANLIESLLEVQGVCPDCNSPLFGWKTKKPDGSERCVPTCMICGYKALKKREKTEVKERYDKAVRGDALAFFLSQSLVTDKKLLNCDLSNYAVVDAETKQAKELALKYVDSVVAGNPSHMILIGKTGVGKSHIAMGICYEAMEKSNYNLKCIVINYRELLEKLKNAFNDREAQREVQGRLMRDIKNADLVVIDDLGAELGGAYAGQSTVYNNDIINSIMEARQNEATIITTNLNGTEVQKAYGKRIVSRISQHLDGFTFTFKQTTDKRKVGVSQ